MNRREVVMTALGATTGLAASASGQDSAGTPELVARERVERLATAWRLGAAKGLAAADEGYRVGVLHIDWAMGQVDVQAETPVPGRAHGLLALHDGG